MTGVRAQFFRDASAADADAIGELHAASWRTTYRGIVSDEFLDRSALENRLALWRGRLSPERAYEYYVRLAIARQALVGFVCVSTTVEAEWGYLLESLHVRPDSKRGGIGRRLMAEAAAWAILQRVDARLHLWVFEQNVAACQFYERLGGDAVERAMGHAPDGGDAVSLRYVWRDPGTLVTV